MEYRAQPQQQRAEDDQRPQDLHVRTERRRADEGEQVTTGLVGDVGDDRATRPPKYRGVKPSYPLPRPEYSAQAMPVAVPMINGLMNPSRKSARPSDPVDLGDSAGQQGPVSNQGVEAGVRDSADHAEGEPVHQVVELRPAGQHSGPIWRMASPTTGTRIATTGRCRGRRAHHETGDVGERDRERDGRVHNSVNRTSSSSGQSEGQRDDRDGLVLPRFTS